MKILYKEMRKFQAKNIFKCFPLIHNINILPFIYLSIYALKPRMFSMIYGPTQSFSNFFCIDGFSLALFQSNTSSPFWKFFMVALWSKYFLILCYLWEVLFKALLRSSSNFNNWFTLFCIGELSFASSVLSTQVKAFSSRLIDIFTSFW